MKSAGYGELPVPSMRFIGVAAGSATQIPAAVRHLLSDPTAWKAASDRCRAFMAREHGEDKVLAAYLDTFEEVMRVGASNPKVLMSNEPRHV